MIIATENIQHEGNEKDKYPHKRLSRAWKPIGRTQKLGQPDQKKYQPQKSEEKKEHPARESSRKRVHCLMHPEKCFIKGRLDTLEDALQKKPRKSGIDAILLRSGFFLFFHAFQLSHP